jgi:mono/diheme cytochrome c family protein
MKRVMLMMIGVSALCALATPAAGAEMTGKEVFDHYCVQCHGPGIAPGTVQLGRTRGKGKALLTERSDLAADYIQYIVRHGLKSMPPYAPSDLTDARLAALAEFLTKKK